MIYVNMYNDLDWPVFIGEHSYKLEIAQAIYATLMGWS